MGQVKRAALSISRLIGIWKVVNRYTAQKAAIRNPANAQPAIRYLIMPPLSHLNFTLTQIEGADLVGLGLGARWLRLYTYSVAIWLSWRPVRSRFTNTDKSKTIALLTGTFELKLATVFEHQLLEVIQGDDLFESLPRRFGAGFDAEDLCGPVGEP